MFAGLSILFMVLTIIGIASIDGTLKKKVRQDERILERLDLIWEEIRKDKDYKH
ncbi:hypothetical protein [Paenibacillus nanensis]|uniref:hypothetical protein n=1 Tax=Paenibacillus nanensis TaxID=393251 RepID=UPI0013C30346|nr:hypothetical protein [Paenibacillus nanensis]